MALRRLTAKTSYNRMHSRMRPHRPMQSADGCLSSGRLGGRRDMLVEEVCFEGFRWLLNGFHAQPLGDDLHVHETMHQQVRFSSKKSAQKRLHGACKTASPSASLRRHRREQSTART